MLQGDPDPNRSGSLVRTFWGSLFSFQQGFVLHHGGKHKSCSSTMQDEPYDGRRFLSLLSFTNLSFLNPWLRLSEIFVHGRFLVRDFFFPCSF